LERLGVVEGSIAGKKGVGKMGKIENIGRIGKMVRKQ
jgi:hypothetical protein